MSRAQGINVSFTKIIGLVISNGLVALSGALLAQYQGSSDINMGKGAIVIGLAAVIVGEALFGWMSRNNFALKMITVVLGAIVYYIVYTTVIYLGLDADLLKLLSAVLVAVFLAVPYWKKKYFSNAAYEEKREQKLAAKAEKKAAKKAVNGKEGN
jgi:putative ABC transport system permease protein